MAYERPGTGPIDYHQCRYGHSKMLFRGPKRDTKSKYYAFLGGSEIYGKYVQVPFVDRVQEATGLTCVNFGAINAGIDAFSNDGCVLDICSGARKTVIQIMGAQNMSNRFYSVHPRRNDRFLKPSALMQTVYREIDFSEFAFTKHLLSTIEVVTPDKFRSIVHELQEAWVARMTKMMQDIKCPKVLLWISDQPPPTEWAGPGLGSDPLFVTQDMIERVSSNAADVVEVVLPHELMAGNLEDMLYPVMEIDAAREMIGPAAHDLIARHVQAAL